MHKLGDWLRKFLEREGFYVKILAMSGFQGFAITYLNFVGLGEWRQLEAVGTKEFGEKRGVLDDTLQSDNKLLMTNNAIKN